MKTEITKISGVTALEIDASAVTYIDSSGVAVLLMARQFCAQQNIALSLPSISAAVHRVLEIAKLDKILPIGQIVSSSDSGVMGVSSADDDTSNVSDDDLAAELLGAAPTPSAPAPSAPASDNGDDSGGDNAGGDDDVTIAPGSFG